MKEMKTPSKLSQRDMAGILKVDTKTLYNWRKHKPELYSIVLLGFKFKELMQAQKDFLSELETIEQWRHCLLLSSPIAHIRTM